jgi:hypothetical protein
VEISFLKIKKSLSIINKTFSNDRSAYPSQQFGMENSKPGIFNKWPKTNYPNTNFPENEAENGSGKLTSSIPTFQHIGNIPPALPQTVYFDFAFINQEDNNCEFKLTQVSVTHFMDPETFEVVYYKPLSSKLYLHSYLYYVELLIYGPQQQIGIIQRQDKVYSAYINFNDLSDYNGQNISLCLFAEHGSKMILN